MAIKVVSIRFLLFQIVAGELEKSNDSGNEQEVNVDTVMMHPDYSKFNPLLHIAVVSGLCLIF
jgi:hypothetical protein